MLLNKIREIFKKKKLIKTYPTSNVSISSIINSKTELEGLNQIGPFSNVADSTIGRCSYIGYKTSLANVKIGRFCSIGSGISVQPARHPTTHVSTYPGFYDSIAVYPFGKGNIKFDEFIKCKNGYYATIGNDVWIGNNVIIKGVVTIGDGAIIGMGAVVTKDVPPYAIVGGVPAKLIKYRFNEETIDAMLKIKWWDWTIERLQQIKDDFVDISDFIEKYKRNI